MNNNLSILKRLNEIEFHDVTVERISFWAGDPSDFTIDFALYNEEKNNYDYWALRFLGIKDLKTDRLFLNPKSSVEITALDIKLDVLFEAEIILLLGFGQPTFSIELKCENIELAKTNSANP
jgi:hypothetical protein